MVASSIPSPRVVAIAKWILGIAACGFVLLGASRVGPAMNPDSVDYLAAADSFARGEGFQAYDGEPFASWPPLYSIVLGTGAKLTAASTLSVAKWFNAISLGAIVILAISWLQTKFRSWLLIPGMLAIFLSPPVFHAANGVRSEPLFLLLCLLFLRILESFVERPSWLAYGSLILIAAAACLTRYVGIVLAITATITAALATQYAFTKRLLALGVAGVLSIVPLLWWIARNRALAGNFSGERSASRLSVPDVLGDLFHTLNHWAIPNAVSNRWPVANAILPLLTAVLIGWAAWTSPQRLRSFWQRNRVGAIFVAAYLTLMVFMSLATHFNRLGDRLLMPAYIPLVVLIFAYLDAMIGASVVPLRRLAAGVSVLVCVALAFPAAVDAELLKDRMAGGSAGMSELAWSEDPLIVRLRGMSKEEVEQLVSNRPKFVCYYTGHSSQLLHALEGGEWADDEIEVAKTRDRGKLLVWFLWNDTDQERFGVWKKSLRLKPILESEHGGLYRIGSDFSETSP